MKQRMDDWKRDWQTLKSLHGRALVVHIWEYYRFFIIAVVCTVIAVGTMASILWEGQKPCRLRVCVVLNSDQSCSAWFYHFGKQLKADGKEGALDVNEDQPFDYDNAYYYLHELEVMTTVSSGRMDVAICGEDMYQYLLALNACFPLDELLPEAGEQMVYSTANLKKDTDGNIELSDGINGFYALNLSETAFAEEYNQETENEPLYAVIIRNTEHLEDAKFLLQSLLA